MIRYSNISSKYLLLSLIFILVSAACTHWAPRVNRYGLPERKYTYQQPEEIGDGWEAASSKEVDNETQFFGDSKNIGDFQINFVIDKEEEVKQATAYYGFRGIQFDKIKRTYNQ
jgi:hypothetical protein